MDTTSTLLTASVVLALLIILMFLMPRLLLKQKKQPREKQQSSLLLDSYQDLAIEMKSLRQQLLVKERLAALGEVSAGIAHEFRNPMGVIAGYARLLLKEFDETDHRRELVLSIVREVEGMNRIMEELLKFSRSEPIKKVSFDLVALISLLLDEMSDPGARPHADLPEALQVHGDETLLRQAIRNLIKNAHDAGGETWVSVQKQMVSGKEGVVVCVRDNGKGIPEEDLEKIFTPFYSTKEEGLGIGLPLVQQIALAHGGTVKVESIQGRGSTFRLFLAAQ